MVYCKLNTTEYDEHFTQSIEKIIHKAVALADDYLIQDDMAEAMGNMLDKLDIKYKWISITAELAPHYWDEEVLVKYLHQKFPDTKHLRVYDANSQYVYIDADGTKYRVIADGDIEKV